MFNNNKTVKMLLKKSVYKRNVLICFLKVPKDSISQVLLGRLFHNIGPFTEKALNSSICLKIMPRDNKKSFGGRV